MQRPLSALLNSISVLERRGNTDPGITDLQYDSRKCSPGSLFFAFPGLHSDGHDYIAQAISRGAAAVIHERMLPRYEDGIAYLRVPDARLAMSPAAAAFHGRPSASLAVIGVTGTEGKSTTVYLIYQLLKLAGKKAGFFSTVMSDSGAGEMPNPEHQTTPEATSVQAMLASMRDGGAEFAVVEASSHGLSSRTGRLADVDFDVGVLTNVTHEHLEFHGTWENYRSDKANLFRNLSQGSVKSWIGADGRDAILTSPPRFGVVNADDPSSGFFAGLSSVPIIRYSDKGAEADYIASEIESDEKGSSFALSGPGGGKIQARIDLPGRFNVGNTLAALAVVSGITGRGWESLVPMLHLLKPVRGRMTRVDRGQPFEVIIDYAHTPSSFETVLPPLRERVEGRILCLFGSGGERDRAKRPLQGKIAAKYCDMLFLCDEDPRGEAPESILEEIASGCPDLERGSSLHLIPDRPTAIRRAFGMARKGDLVLLLGKGHENSIIYSDKTLPYDEISEAERALDELGFGNRQ
ncbi:MAG TPA: UDP-N-acetylmuramoyl-L-alanyl-D-glutamate--2,6-diaminopimelate ligase [Rectinemataceae bacterium]